MKQAKINQKENLEQMKQLIVSKENVDLDRDIYLEIDEKMIASDKNEQDAIHALYEQLNFKIEGNERK